MFSSTILCSIPLSSALLSSINVVSGSSVETSTIKSLSSCSSDKGCISKSSSNNVSNSLFSSLKIAVDSASSCWRNANSRLDFRRKMSRNMPVNNNNGNKMAKINMEVDELMTRKIVFKMPGPLNGGSSIASI